MSAAADIGMAAASLGVLGMGGVAGWARYLHRTGSSIAGRWVGRHIAPIVTAELAPVIEQLSPNHGTSAVDRLDRLTQWTEDADSRFDRIDEAQAKAAIRMDRHLEAHTK